VSAPARKRPRLGLLLDNLFDRYEEQLWRTVVHAAEAEDVSLHCFLAGPARGRRLKRVIFDLISKETVDGIIGLFGTLNMGTDGVDSPAAEEAAQQVNAAGCFGEHEIHAYLERCGNLPTVSVGKLVPGIPSLVVDNEAGVREVLSHLIEVHGRRRIAFICGPELNQEAEERLNGYRAALEQHGIPYDPDLVCPGDFTVQAGTRAIGILLDERRVEVDAIMAANDQMAIHALHELQDRGVRVPEAIAVAGFDDQWDAASVAPPLTTVAQPLWTMGVESVKQILSLIRGEVVAPITKLPTQAVIRRSCGCVVSAEARAPEIGPRTDPAPLVGRIEAAQVLPPSRPGERSPAERLADALRGLPQDPGGNRFLETLDAELSRGFALGITPRYWQGLVLELLEAARHAFRGSAGDPLIGLAVRATALIGDRAEQAQSARAYELEQEAFVLQHVFRITGVDEDELTVAIREQLPRLGVGSFYLVRNIDCAGKEAVVDFQYDLKGRVQLDPAPGPFPPRRLLPGRFTDDQRYAYVIMPMVFGVEETGFSLCEIGAMTGTAYEALANQLGRALKASALMSEVKLYASELEHRVDERARQLREAQEQLVEVAHEAGMAEIAVGTLHNVGNLLNNISVAAESVSAKVSEGKLDGLLQLADLLQANRDDLAGFVERDPRAKLLPEYCRKLGERLLNERESTRAEVVDLRASIALARDSVVSLQEYARDGQDRLLTDRIDLAVMVDAALRLQTANIARTHVRVEKRMASIPPVPLQRFKVMHVLINLIKNAVEAMQGSAGERVLTVELARRSDRSVALQIADTGEGISVDNLKKLFSYAFTTKRDGHGFGLHASANYIKQMGGQLIAQSDGPGRGARFTLVFPNT
jgi:signal transduction histidine kinase/ABC-type sugar transport system substrate-binding protein